MPWPWLSLPSLAVLGLVAFTGFVLFRLWRSLRIGLSIRMQVFVAMAALSGGFSALTSLYAIHRLEARALRIHAQTAIAQPGTELVMRSLREVAAGAAILSLLLVVATALAAALIGRAIAKPIERLTHAASRIAQGERHVTLPRPFGREVRTLTAALESMRRELEGHHLAERLAVDLSHELKNPVAAIRAAAEVLADGALDEPSTARRFVSRIREAADRLQSIVHNLLALTRLQARGVGEEQVDLATVCEQAVEAHAALAEQRMLRIHLDLGTAEDAIATSDEAQRFVTCGDATWLRRAIDNLIDNALAFATQPAPGANEPAIHLQLRSDAEKVSLDVSNLGPGIDPSVRDRLFERFVTTRRDSGGSGLGLAIVAAVAEQHRGRIELVTPGPPQTRFRLSLPRSKDAWTLTR
ncbi:MAG: HAMP domain-containing protein [Myxococcales bacterium]|nr:HAMP domain-containing protein [Myxococcales bacterium]